MSKAAKKKSPYRALRVTLSIIKVSAIIAVIVSIITPSGLGLAAAVMVAILAATSLVTIDIAQRLAEPAPTLDTLLVLKNIQQILEAVREGQILQSKDPQTVLRYVKRRYPGVGFPEGEATIASDAQAAFDYAINILGLPFPAGEAAIAKNGALAYEYARRVVGGPFPDGEPAIRQDAAASRGYEQFLQVWAASLPKPR